MSTSSSSTSTPIGLRARRTRRAAAAVGLAAALGATAACSTTDAGETLDEATDSGTITVGYAGEAPHSFVDENGELTGSAIAIDSAVYEELGIDTVDGTLVNFGDLIPGLKAGHFDAVSANMSILPERCEEVAFSEPTFRYTTALMVPEGNPMDLTDLDSAKEAGAKVAVMGGAIEGSYAEDLGMDATTVDDAQTGMEAVTSGRVDAFALTAVSLNWMKKQQPDAPVEVTESFVQVIDGVPQEGAGGATFNKEDTELVEAFNDKLTEITGDKEKFLELTEPFGYTEAEIPDPELTTEILCEGI